MRYILAIAIGFALTLGFGWIVVSYSGSADFSSWVPKQELAAAEHVADLIRTRKFDRVGASLDPRFRWGTPDAMQRMAGFFPGGASFKTRVTGWQSSWRKALNGQATTSQALLQIHYVYPDDRAVQATFLFQRDNGKETITGINFAPLTPAQSRMGEFDLASMNGVQSVILVLAILIETFAFATCALCLMGPQPRWRTRWLWALASLVGVLRVNAVFWTTGQLTFVPVSILFPPVGMTQIPVGTPWVFGFSLPLGAILYWVLRNNRGWDKPATADAVDLQF